MKEKLSFFLLFAKEREKTGDLYYFARHARGVYFSDQYRKEKQDGGPFNVSESMSTSTIEAVENSLNRTLDVGGKIAIIDLTQGGMIRMHALQAKHYSRFVLPGDPHQHRVEEDRKGDFSVLLSGSVFHTSPSLFLDIVSDKSTIDISWQEHEDPNSRLAVLTHQKGIWEVVLDFRINPWEGDPAWKVNTQVYTH